MMETAAGASLFSSEQALLSKTSHSRPGSRQKSLVWSSWVGGGSGFKMLTHVLCQRAESGGTTR